MYTILYMSKQVLQGKVKMHTLRIERSDVGAARVKVDGVLYYRVSVKPCRNVSKFVAVYNDAGELVGY